jgi:hypothetical protein
MEFKETSWGSNPKWNTIEFKGRWTSMEVSSADHEETVEFSMVVHDEEFRVFLNQENLKQLITHLQKQIK